MKKKVIIGIVLFLVLGFIAFMMIDNTVEDQTAAIITAIEEAEAESEEFLLIRYDDLEGQVEAALGNLEKDKEEYSYPIIVNLISDEAIRELDVTMPEIAYDLNTYYNDYRKEAESIILEEMGNNLREDTSLELVEHELNVVLKRIDDNWVAELNEEEINSIKWSYDWQMEMVAYGVVTNSEAYKFLYAVRDWEFYYENKMKSLDFYKYISLTDAKKQGDTYEFTYEYPDPLELYDKIYEKVYKQHAAKGKTYEATNIENIQADMKVYLKELAADSTIKTATMNGKTKEEIEEKQYELFKQVNDIVYDKSSKLVEVINSEFFIAAQDLPSTGVLYGSNKGQPIYVKTSSDLGNLHISFYKLPGFDLSEKGEKALSAFLVAGKNLTVRLPAGNYKLIQGTGQTWYGDEYSFGPSGSYQVSDILITIDRGFTYTLTLYGVADGNMPTSRIGYPY